MSKVLVDVKIRDNDNELFSKNIQVEINSIDYLIIQDAMRICSCEEYDESWEKLIQTIENNNFYLPKDWYVSGKIKLVEKIYENT
ncbi:MAG: hypothetical protein IKB98_01500 [Clostridia bacterium]|nr:hypothetical protein [Clostridia bacterium]